LIGPVGVPLVGFVATDDASCNHTDLAVASHMAGNAADDSAFDTSFRLSGGRSQCDAQNGGADDPRLHGGSPKRPVAATIRLAVIGSHWEFAGNIAVQVAISIAGIVLMIAAATLMAWTSQLDRHGPKLF
jgi:hypothetical protein